MRKLLSLPLYILLVTSHGRADGTSHTNSTSPDAVWHDLETEVEREINQYRTEQQIQDKPVTWEIIEESLKNAVLSWWSKVY